MPNTNRTKKTFLRKKVRENDDALKHRSGAECASVVHFSL
jgi:hypothetical protein